jgi:hypothetical protein
MSGVPIPDNVKVIAAKCPVCEAIIPMFTIEVERYGFLNLRARLTVDGDATDWVAHIWSHSELSQL